MKVKLTALKDFEAINTWQEEVTVQEGEVLEGNVTILETGGKIITIELNGVDTPFWEKTVKEFFKIEEVN